MSISENGLLKKKALDQFRFRCHIAAQIEKVNNAELRAGSRRSNS